MYKNEQGPISINDLSLDEQLKIVKEDFCNINYFKNVSEKLQLAIVKQNGYAIREIENPSEQVQLEAVRENGLVIQYIDRPSEKLQLIAVRENGLAIEYINNPSERVQLEAVMHDVYAINHIENPTEYIKSITSQIKTSERTVYVLHEPGKEPLFSIGCQNNISKECFIWRIYNTDGGLRENPHRQEYLDIIERY